MTRCILARRTMRTRFGELIDPAGNASFDAVSPEACAAMYGTFLTAKSSGRSVKFWYSSASSMPNCQWGAQGDWAIPDPYPYYFEIVD